MNEMELIQQGFIVFCIVITIWVCFLSGMIFGKLGDWLHKKNAPDWLRNPLVECPVCAAPYYGTAAYWIIWGNSWQEWILVILIAMGMATIFVKLKRN